ncbi:hypothetical protein K3495_g4016 [Podosphaera aphanis]|nr:hypothetical protein K3495_g4016 [Podosphaera aphanis]
MPRGSTTTKRQQVAANQRDSRHEGELVSPMRQNRKLKSHGGHYSNRQAKTAKGYLLSTPSPPASPAPMTLGYEHYAALGDSGISIKADPADLARDFSTSDSDCSSTAYHHLSDIYTQENHRQIDVNATKNPGVHRNLGPLSLVVTVLRSCPLRDTLAILIVLLQIPPTFLSLIHLLFATLTFVPSSSVVASGLTYTDLLQVTLGMPSFTIILLLDLVVLLVWLLQRSPIQDVVLELAQIVIALTLGGGVYAKQAGIKSIFWCFGILGTSHVIRAVNDKNTGLQTLIPSHVGPHFDPDVPLEPVVQSSRKKLGLIRSALAIHILAQGTVRYIRDWYVKRERRDTSSSILLDAEVGKSPLDFNSDVSSSLTVESEFSTSSSVSSVRSAPKTEKHTAQVRIRQPLWAALASTKIIMAKEYESSHTAAESAGTNSTDLNNLGNAPFYSEVGRIWITYVGSDEIFFSTSFFPTIVTDEEEEVMVVAEQKEQGEEGKREGEGEMEGEEKEQENGMRERNDESNLDASNIDRSKPFYVKVNHTVWQPTKIYPTTDADQPIGSTTKWTGEILGLAPTTNYHCDFFSTVDDSLIFTSSIRTIPSPTADLGYSSSTKDDQRPSSPYTTLKTSIAQAEKKLDDDRQRQKSIRKELRVKLNAVRREFERLVSSIASTGGNDDKLRQKAQQSTLHMKQADEAAAVLVSQIETIDNIPTDETSLYSKRRSEIQLQREKHKNFRSEFSAGQLKLERDIQSLKSDLSGLQQKSESRKQRLNILNSRHKSIADANAKGLDEAQRRESEREVKRKERANIQAFYTERLQSISLQIYEGQSALHIVTAVIETLLQAQQDLYQNHSPTSSLQNLNGISCSIPEHPSGYPWNTPVTSPNIFSGSSYSPMLSTVMPTFKPGHRTRGRSSSMLSNLSKFTQSSDEAPLLSFVGKKLRSWDDTLDDSKYSSGSPSGTGSGTGSVGDPKSPILVNEKIAPRRR